jgi:hypothetical protein
MDILFWLLIGLVITTIVTSLYGWPGKMKELNKIYVENQAVLTVGCETMINAANGAINRLRLLADSDEDVDTAVADLIWARDYVMKRAENLDLHIVNGPEGDAA